MTDRANDKERAGERVFGNADEALAEKIISRSKKNSGEPTPTFGGYGVDWDDGDSQCSSNENNISVDSGISDASRINPKKCAIIKIAVPIALAAIALWILTLGRRDD